MKPPTPSLSQVDPARSLLLTDLYELNMLQAYLDRGMTAPAVFEFFVRKMPPERGFFVAAGLGPVLDFLRAARFEAPELDWLRASGRFGSDLVDYLADLRFAGDVHAMAEGTVFFADEPILRLTAPLPVAQLLETRIINLLHVQTLVATKAARMVLAGTGRTLVDFGLRRAHGAEAGLLAARAAYLAGFAATATTLAGPRFGIPIVGTMAHSFVLAHDSETAAFEAFARSRPDSVVLLVDTYDTERGAKKVVALAPKLRDAGIRVAGVRLDSGDLADHAHRVRRILDAGGLGDVGIFASGGIDEHEILRIVRDGAPISGFGIGTSLTTSQDCPALDCAYKLQEYDGQPRRKRSEGKATWPGRKQVFRRLSDDGRFAGDVLTVEGDDADGGPLIRQVLAGGEPVAPAPDLDAIRAHAADQLARLPEHLRRLERDPSYPVEVSAALRATAEEADRVADAADAAG